MILPPGIGWYELLTLDADELAQRGLTDPVSTARLTYTGTERMWSERWARTVGSWGRVQRPDHIASVAEVDVRAVRQRAKTWQLKYATSRECRTQAELALLCYFDRDRAPERVRRALGILEVERRWYCGAVQLLCDEEGWTPHELLRTDLPDYVEAWDTCGLELGPPTPEPFDITDTAALKALVARAKAEM